MREGDHAFVLHRRPYGEKDLLLELWTRGQGRLPVMAHRVRGSRGNRQAELVPYQALLVSLRGRGEVLSLQAWECGPSQPPPLGQDALTGLYLNELLYRLLPRGEPESGLFDHYAGLLAQLAPSAVSAEPVAERTARLDPLLRAFELALLAALGYGLILSETHAGAPVDPHARYLVDLQGGVRLVQDGPWTGRVLLSLAALQERFPDQTLELNLRREQRRLLRSLLSELLGDRPLRSWSLGAAGLAPASRHQGESAG